MKSADLFVSVVAPVHNGGAALLDFAREALDILRRQCSHYELLFVDDDSTTSNLQADALLALDPHVRLIRLSRRHGPDVATIAGIESAIGDYVLILQPEGDPPAAIRDMLSLFQQGTDVIQGVAENEPREGWLFRLCQSAFHALCRRLLRVDVPSHTSSLLGFSRRALNAITRVKHKHRPLALLGCSVGFPRRTLVYRKTYRGRHPVRRSLPQAFERGLATLVTHSVSPLRFLTYLGCGAGLLNFLYCIYVLAVNLFKAQVAEGWTTLSLQISVMFLFVFVILASMAEYLSRILEETKDQPLYHLLEERGSSTISVDPAVRNVTAYQAVPANGKNEERQPHAA